MPEPLVRAQYVVPELPAFSPELCDSIDLPMLIPRVEAHGSIEVSTTTLLEPQDLWSRLRGRFALDPSLERKRVVAELRWLTKNPAYMGRVIHRSRRYLHYILGEIEARDIPAEIALLPVVESAFDPFAYSHGRAAGLWQFIPGTANRYGLRRDWWVDERRDVIASTRAALDYLQALERRFKGDWLLALAAYNSGEGRVWKATLRAKTTPADGGPADRGPADGGPADFWSLGLPPETRTYVPRLLALAILVNDPAAYGLSLEPLADLPYFGIVDTGSQIDLKQAASLAAIELQELYWLNPGFNQFATHPDGPHRLLLPTASVAHFSSALANLPPEERIAWKRYVVKSRDTLSHIAMRHHVSTDTLRRVNALRGDFIRNGQALLIPTAMSSAGDYVMSESQRRERRIERLSRNHAGREIRYRARSGDSLWEIARRHGVGVRALARWNSMAPTDTLVVGRELAIYVPAEVAVTSLPGERPVVRKIGYRVRRGDSLSRIAHRFRVTVAEIVKWNSVNPGRYLQPGQLLTLFVNVTNMGD
ncbi:MAG: LysM peptidoglycan-binding domain-containing protein [Pseudomonadales bacterium]